MFQAQEQIQDLLKGGGCRKSESCAQNVAFELESNLKLLHQK